MLLLGGATILQYTTPGISKGLARAIDSVMAASGVPADPRSVIPTAGSQMGLAAIAQSFAREGQVIACEAPTYPGALAAFRAAGARIVSIDITGGLTEESLAAQLDAAPERPALYYTNPNFHNPTGATHDRVSRELIAAACADRGVRIVEDDPYGLLSFDGEPTPVPFAELAPSTIYLGTFSKIFAPGLRIGWISAPEDVRARLAHVVESMTLSPAPLNHAIAAGFFALGDWKGLVADYRDTYRRQGAAMTRALAETFGDASGWTWNEPGGGFYVWLTHDDVSLDARDLLPMAATEGVSFVPGAFFSAQDDYRNCLRLCFSANSPDKTEEGIARLARALSARPVEVAP
nr:PLP-dependent aminotransferase family protein [Flexivirga meconopsidis]